MIAFITRVYLLPYPQSRAEEKVRKCIEPKLGMGVVKKPEPSMHRSNLGYAGHWAIPFKRSLLEFRGLLDWGGHKEVTLVIPESEDPKITATQASFYSLYPSPPQASNALSLV